MHEDIAAGCGSSGRVEHVGPATTLGTSAMTAVVSSDRGSSVDGPLRAVVVGTGGIAQEHLAFLQHSPLARLAGVCDLSPAAATYAAERFGADVHGDDLASVLERTAPDVVHVLTPAVTHHRIVQQCLRAGAHVISEKPITTSLGHLEELLSTAEEVGKVVTEDHNYLFNRGVTRLIELVSTGRLGDVVDVEVRIALDVRGEGPFSDANRPHPIHQMPAGVVHDVLTHLCYLTLQFVPGPFDEVRAAWRNHGGGPTFKFDDLDAVAIAGHRHARIRFTAQEWPQSLSVSVRGTQGRAETELFQPHSTEVLQRRAGQQLSSTVNHIVNGVASVWSAARNMGNKLSRFETPYHGLHSYLDRTYAALAEGRPVPVDAARMRATTALMERLLDEESAW